MAETEPAKTDTVRGFYNKLNEDTSFACRLNDENLTEQQKADFQSLHEDIRKRYYGSGISIPENVEGKRILDVGCGSGTLVFMLSKLVGPSGYVVGIDIAEGLIQTAQNLSEYHYKMWGYTRANFEFRHLDALKLEESDFRDGEFDIIVSNGVLCLICNKDPVFRSVYRLLKPGGQFFLNDAYGEKDAPTCSKGNDTLWSLCTAGAMRWDRLSCVAGSVGFTTPHLTSVAPVGILNEQYKQLLGNSRYTCGGWRLFKLAPDARKQGASLVTYNGGITDHPDVFQWDVDLSFKKGEGVEVDAELSTLLYNCYLSSCFTFKPASGQPVTRRNQNPFQLMDKLKAEGKLPEQIYKLE